MIRFIILIVEECVVIGKLLSIAAMAALVSFSAHAIPAEKCGWTDPADRWIYCDIPMPPAPLSEWLPSAGGVLVGGILLLVCAHLRNRRPGVPV